MDGHRGFVIIVLGFKRRFAAQIAFIRRESFGACIGALITIAEGVQAISKELFMRPGAHIID